MFSCAISLLRGGIHNNHVSNVEELVKRAMIKMPVECYRFLELLMKLFQNGTHILYGEKML